MFAPKHCFFPYANGSLSASLKAILPVLRRLHVPAPGTDTRGALIISRHRL